MKERPGSIGSRHNGPESGLEHGSGAGRRLFKGGKSAILPSVRVAEFISSWSGESTMRMAMAAIGAVILQAAWAGGAMALPAAPYQGLPAGHQATIWRVGLPFWGENFPLHYTWSLARACTRLVPVETPRGTRLERVWVCAARRR